MTEIGKPLRRIEIIPEHVPDSAPVEPSRDPERVPVEPETVPA